MAGTAATATSIVLREAVVRAPRLPWNSSCRLALSSVQWHRCSHNTHFGLNTLAGRHKSKRNLSNPSSFIANFSTIGSLRNEDTNTMDKSTTAGTADAPQGDESKAVTASNDGKNNKRNAEVEKGDNSSSTIPDKDRRNKKFKKEMSENHTRRPTEKQRNRAKHTNYDENTDERLAVPHEGSFANPELREKFGIKLERNVHVTTEEGGADGEDKKHLKRKVALFLGFLGTNYGGFQMNADQRTIQAEIELALYRAGLVNEFNFGKSHKYSWSSSARTDKGVHACAQVCSLKMELDPADLEIDEKRQRETGIGTLETVRQKLQHHLPSDICVLDLLRTTRNFCAKTQRDKVRYSYMIPSFVLHPEWRSVLIELGIPLEGRQDIAKEPLSKDEIQQLQSKMRGYRSTPEQRELLQKALSAYEGTHSFHNFTKGLRPGQASANRYILEFIVQDPILVPETVEDNDSSTQVEWIPTYVLGQSFLLHQIRKMVSMAIDVARGVAPLSVLTDKALHPQEEMRVALAPAQGLFLELSYFDGYNRRKSQPHQKKNRKQQQQAGGEEPPDLDWSVDGPARARWMNFRDKIRQHIVEEEEEQGNFLQYLYTQECVFEYKKFYGLEDHDNEETKEAAKDDGSG